MRAITTLSNVELAIARIHDDDLVGALDAATQAVAASMRDEAEAGRLVQQGGRTGNAKAYAARVAAAAALKR